MYVYGSFQYTVSKISLQLQMDLCHYNAVKLSMAELEIVDE